MTDSIAFRSLSGSAVKVYLDLRRRYNGSNNGEIRYSLGVAADRLFLGKATVKRALAELVAKGFIAMTGRGGWLGRKAATWAVTDKHRGNALPTNDWRQWRPSPVSLRHPKGRCGSEATPESDDLSVRVSAEHPSGRQKAA
jgi:predicted transcriptional regulator